MTIVSRLLPVLRPNGIIRPMIIQTSKFSLSSRLSSDQKESGIAKRPKSQDRADVSTDVRPLGEKIKETTKTVSYTGVILVGVGVTGIIFYYVFKELFSSNSANSIYSEALEKCKNDPRIQDALGTPIKGFGEETTRRRRTHVSHALYTKNGSEYMRMKFYIQGIRNKGVVEVDLKRNEFGNYITRYLLVQLDDYSGKTFVIEDNRKELDLDNVPGLGSQLGLSLKEVE